jgi:hypothetical protein
MHASACPPSSCPLPLQLTERRQGNEAYRGKKYQQALHHYERARAVVEFVQVCADASVARNMLCMPSMHCWCQQLCRLWQSKGVIPRIKCSLELTHWRMRNKTAGAEPGRPAGD